MHRLNGDTGGIKLSTNSSYQPQLYWQLHCGNIEHHMTMQTKSVYQSWRKSKADLPYPACLHCNRCEPPLPHSRGPSELEKHLRGVLAGMGIEFEVEVKALRGRYGACDAWLPQHGLGILADGPHHTQVDIHGKSRLDQAVTDMIFNMAVLASPHKQVHGLVRLHHADTHSWADCIAAARDECAHPCKQGKFVMFSPAFQQETMWL